MKNITMVLTLVVLGACGRMPTAPKTVTPKAANSACIITTKVPVTEVGGRVDTLNIIVHYSVCPDTTK